jgi:hypothetical protein
MKTKTTKLTLTILICALHPETNQVKALERLEPRKNPPRVVESLDKKIAPYGMENDFVLEEAGSMSESANPFWWLNSGGYFTVNNGYGRSIWKELDSNDRWYKAYAKANPLDTERGSRPQNIFRLIAKKSGLHIKQEAHFVVMDYFESASPNRAGHNGIHLFSRYSNGNNTYYSGIRVDGRAVIKKKAKGVYYTLAQSKVIGGDFDRKLNPSLLPARSIIGLRSQVRERPDGSVRLSLELDIGGNEKWQEAVTVVDDGKFGGPPLTRGFGGIRTDFMDILVFGYKLQVW